MPSLLLKQRNYMSMLGGDNACMGCGEKTGMHLVLAAVEAGMQPRVWPHRPSVIELRNNGRRFPPNYLHESWVDYLYWDSELEA